ncbi:spermidine synthase [Pseudoxanthomonas sacheonensis]|uniref:spermidine synthase n=1 Tax=Pseudoxanthomonas sacheonensis TaxID=443615 RepID=UPI0013D7F14B|nr:spermine synthase [Pseudoxanthomonas sacheonensis]KAF1708604.1 spermine synthase [Pseudoxanthomonas sacheonensis]
MKTNRLGWALLGLFVLSGFAGLIYQSVWSHYLGLTLGHAAYAQTLVLAIFMGGMALGAWFVSRRSFGWRRLILGYALVELLIGVVGLGFQPIFEGYTAFSQQTALPAIGNAGLAHLYQWTTAALLILPQSLLLGATFPLMSAGYLRVAPQEDGEILGGLYFTNSLGAALGALAATFLLLPAVGLPGTVMTAGLLNILVAMGAWAVSKWLDQEDEGGKSRPAATAVAAEESEEAVRLGRILLMATAVSGAASFVYEIGWVRLLNQALGATVHSFELMLAAFILGLAFGGLWIRRRSAALTEPVRYVGYVQVLMGVAALVSVPVFAQSFRWVGWMLDALSRSDNGYALFELGTAGIALLVMFPAAFFAGMTLPLFTVTLLRAGAGERVIGRIYAANTLGAIAGVMLVVHVMIPVVGVKMSVMLAALADIGLGLYLLRAVNPARLTKGVVFATSAAVVVLCASLQLGQVEPRMQVSGVFRTGKTMVGNESTTVPFLKDGKTATVAVYRSENPLQMGIATNGKPDAALTTLRDPPTSDEVTMMMAGLIPLALHPAPRDVAVIGWGSGLTTHTLLGSPVPRNVDTIEIEQVMYEGAKLFGNRVARAYEDPRSHLRVDDARTFFSTGARQYDVIVSEPSNPWVSGVASLFTREFYGFMKSHLRNDGILVQWLHTYELDDRLVGTMLAALAEQFPDAQLYLTNGADMLIVASKGKAQPLNAGPWQEQVLAAELRRVGLGMPDEVELRRIGSAELIRQFVRMSNVVPHSDYFPTVSLQAPKTRFEKKNSEFLQQLVVNGLPVLDVVECRKPLGAAAQVAVTEESTFSQWRAVSLLIAKAMREGRASTELRQRSEVSAKEVEYALSLSRFELADPVAFKAWTKAASVLASSTIGHLPSEDVADLWAAPTWLSPQARQLPQVSAVLQAYEAAAMRDPAAMRANARVVLGMPSNSMAPEMREQMLVIAMLGALGSGDRAALPAMEKLYGVRGDVSNNFASVRGFLMAWADSPAQVCMARKPLTAQAN